MRNNKLFNAAALLLSAAIVLSACGGNAENAGNSGNDTASTAPEEEKASQELQTEESEDTEATETEETAADVQDDNAEAADAEQGSRFPAFTSCQLDGTEITSDIFAEKDVTVLNIWGTYCPPCIAEMPELAEWSRSMPDNVQLVGLVIDVWGMETPDETAAAVSILEEAGADFKQITMGEDLMEFAVQIYAVPTTVFIDRTGKLVGEAVVGADVASYKSQVESILSSL